MAKVFTPEEREEVKARIVEFVRLSGRETFRQLPSLRRANLALRRAKSDVQKWERVCAALRELNKHRDIVRQITDSSRRVVSEK
ncbi:DUF1627 domain-containing protein [Escherichia coli]|nr:DUF1627 domain-containing protein [Escherichia coli]NAK07604.1 DUF1627 domain-containing protein [Escherichia coli]NAK70912.1 DUF1627 domain-containing protein [Escherichia coli]